MPIDPSDQIVITHAATGLLHEYQALVDAKDIDGLSKIIHPDVELTRYDGTKHGAENFLDLYRRFAASDVQVAQHMGTNVIATRNDDGSVDSRSTFLAITLHEAGGARFVWGRYHDTIAEHGDRWVITAKRIAVARTALIGEDMLAPTDIDTFGVIPQ